MRHKILKLFIIHALLLFGSVFLVDMLTNVLLLTLCNLIFGSKLGMPLCMVLVRFLLPVIITISFCIINARNDDNHREYLKSMEGRPYDAKEDLTLVLHDRMYWAECIIFASLFLVVTFTVNKPVWIFPVSIPLFVVFDGWWRMHLHKSWANGRMRQ